MKDQKMMNYIEYLYDNRDYKDIYDTLASEKLDDFLKDLFFQVDEKKKDWIKFRDNPMEVL